MRQLSEEYINKIIELKRKMDGLKKDSSKTYKDVVPTELPKDEYDQWLAYAAECRDVSIAMDRVPWWGVVIYNESK